MTKLGYQIPNFTYPGVPPERLFRTISEVAVTAEDSGFDTLFVMDHFFQLPLLGPPSNEMFEAYTLLGAIAARTERLRLGTLVTGVTYRNPAILAKEVTALDVISEGRALLGIGAAWFQEEHDALGVRFPPMKERFERLEDALRIAQAMFTEERSSVAGTHDSIVDAWNSPRPIQDGGPPILIGGSGERKTFRMAAQYADELNMICDPAEVPHKLEVLQGHLDDLGRDRSTITTSTLAFGLVAETRAEVDETMAGFLAGMGVDDAAAVVKDPARLQASFPRMMWGTPDQFAEQARELLDLGLDAIVVNLPANGHDPAIVRLAGEILDAVVPAR